MCHFQVFATDLPSTRQAFYHWASEAILVSCYDIVMYDSSLQKGALKWNSDSVF